jgi:hypothetical protein
MSETLLSSEHRTTAALRGAGGSIGAAPGRARRRRAAKAGASVELAATAAMARGWLPSERAVGRWWEWWRDGGLVGTRQW